jgi:hypothetical protein
MSESIFNFDEILSNNDDSIIDNYIEYIKIILNEDSNGILKEILLNKIISTINDLIKNEWIIKIKYNNSPVVNFINFIFKLKITVLKEDEVIDNFIYQLITLTLSNFRVTLQQRNIQICFILDFLCTLFIIFHQNNEFLVALPCYDELINDNPNELVDLFWYFKREIKYFNYSEKLKELFDTYINNELLLVKLKNILNYDSICNIILQIEEINEVEKKIKLNKLSGTAYTFDNILFDLNNLDQLYIFISNKLDINIFNLELIKNIE